MYYYTRDQSTGKIVRCSSRLGSSCTRAFWLRHACSTCSIVAVDVVVSWENCRRREIPHKLQLTVPVCMQELARDEILCYSNMWMEYLPMLYTYNNISIHTSYTQSQNRQLGSADNSLKSVVFQLRTLLVSNYYKKFSRQQQKDNSRRPRSACPHK